MLSDVPCHVAMWVDIETYDITITCTLHMQMPNVQMCFCADNKNPICGQKKFIVYICMKLRELWIEENF